MAYSPVQMFRGGVLLTVLWCLLASAFPAAASNSTGQPDTSQSQPGGVQPAAGEPDQEAPAEEEFKLVKLVGLGEKGDYIGTRPQISGQLSAPVPADKLVVVLDGVDVTGLLTVGEDGFSFRPAAILAAGGHLLTVYILSDDADPIQEDHDFNTRHSQSFRELYAEGDLSALFEVALERSDDGDYPNMRAEGNLGMNAKASEGNWDLDFRTNLRYLDQSAPVEDPESKGVQVADYLLTGTYELGRNFVKAELGDLRVEQTEFTATRLARRGGQVGAGLGPLMLSTFMVSAKQYYGNQGGLGLGDPDVDQIMGWSSGLRFWDESLLFKVTQVFGKGGGSSFGVHDEAGQEGSNTWSGLLSLDPFEGLLVAEAEYALSDYDPDEADGSDGEKDRAWRAGVQGDLEPFTYSVLYKKVGPEYEVVGNNYVQGDQEGYEAQLGAASQNHAVEAVYSHFNDNVEKDEFFPVVDRRDLILTYTFTRFETMPITLSYQKTLLESSDEPTDDDRVDLDGDTYTLATAYSAGIWTLGFQTSYATNKDKIDPANSESSFSVSFAPSLSLDNLSLTPVLAYTRSGLQQSGEYTDIYTATLDLHGRLFKRQFSYGFSGTYNQTHSPGESHAQRSLNLKGEVAYQLPTDWLGKVKPAVGLRGTYIKEDSGGDDQNETIIVYLFIQADVPFSF
jgi:hypothetical protein